MDVDLDPFAVLKDGIKEELVAFAVHWGLASSCLAKSVAYK